MGRGQAAAPHAINQPRRQGKALSSDDMLLEVGRAATKTPGMTPERVMQVAVTWDAAQMPSVSLRRALGSMRRPYCAAAWSFGVFF